MAEGGARDYSTMPDTLHPKTVMDSLVRIRDDLDTRLDHEVLDEVWSVLRRCAVPEIIEGFRMGLQHPQRRKACDLENSVWGVLEGSIVVLGTLVVRMGNDGFNSPGMELDLENKLQGTLKKLHKLKTVARACGASAYEVWVLEEDLHVLSSLFNHYMHKRHPFQKAPSLTDLSAPLWNKLRKISFQEINEEAKITSCCVCFEPLEGIDFAILDNCSHLMCTNCAHRILSTPDAKTRRCPMCRAVVGVYTSAAAFAHFKASTSFKSRTWKMLNSIKRKICKRN